MSLSQLTKKIPYHVIHKHIIPYTYSTQSKNLLDDIKSFISDKKLLEASNDYYINNFFLLIDLLRFYEYSLVTKIIKPELYILLQRHIKYKNNTPLIDKFIFDTRITFKQKRTVNLLLALMTPFERTRFFNKYVLNN
tara:strand:+ start:64 stop:474 length:411 start_codon:yes stop_codon:yes gene_type:complete